MESQPPAPPITVNAYGEAAHAKRRRTVAAEHGGSVGGAAASVQVGAKQDALRVRKLKERTR